MSWWAGQQVLVTGAGGFLGGWLSLALRECGATVVAMGRRDAGLASLAADGADIIAGDLREAGSVAQAFRDRRIDTVFHLAAQTLPTLARQSPALTFDVNARGTWNLLDAARAAPAVPRIVIASTDSVYGENDGSPFDEDASLAPSFPYEASKACADIIAQCYHRTFGMSICVARFCNIFGPGDIAPSRLITGATEAAIKGERQRLRGDGSAIRNYLFVEDAVAGLLALAETADRQDVAGEAFNFCDETPYSVREVIDRILALVGRPDLSPILGPGAPSEISIKRASAAKARRVLGWRPRVGLDEGLRRTIGWQRARLAQPGDALPRERVA